MTIFLRSDLLEFPCRKVPGTSHVRPRKANGDPIPVWGVDCPPCEVAEASNPQVSRSRHRIPLTPDEEDEAREAQKMAEAALHQQQIMLARQAAEAAQSVRLGGLEPTLDADDVAITTSADNVSGDTGRPAATAPADHAASYTPMTKADLVELARDRGLPVTGTKAELVRRHADHDASLADR